jgi:hypothetical protein
MWFQMPDMSNVVGADDEEQYLEEEFEAFLSPGCTAEGEASELPSRADSPEASTAVSVAVESQVKHGCFGKPRYAYDSSGSNARIR